MIRPITINDRETYLTLAQEFYNSEAVLHTIPYQHFLDTFDEMMRSNIYAECFIIEHDGEIAGYALIAKTFSQEAGGLAVWVEELYIKPQFRSLGLGSEFFDYLEKTIPAKRYRLEIEPENIRAKALYLRKGFSALSYKQLVKEK